jgi:uncharacterized protein (DUF2126 family)
LLRDGQGKWYPGETLPRWTFSLVWRRDGVPLWTDPALIAAEGAETGVGHAEAAALLAEIARELALDTSCILPAFEDPAHWVLREANLPANLTPDTPKLKDPEERQRMSRVFARGLTEPASYVLPVQSWQGRA